MSDRRGQRNGFLHPLIWLTTLVLAASMLALTASLGPAAAQASWRVLGEGAADPPTFRKPTALAVDGSGNVYVADEGYGFVIRVSAEGEYGGAWGRDLNVQEIAKPAALAVAGDGSVYVADRDTRAIHRLSPDGTILSSWETGTATSLALDREGNLYAGYSGPGDGRLNNQYHLQKLSPSGEQLGRWILGASGGAGSPSRGTASGATYYGVSAVTIDPAGGALFLEGRSNYSRDSHGEESHTYAELARLDPAAPSWSATVVSSKTLAGGEAGDGPGRFVGPKGLAVSAAGQIFVADAGNHRVQELGPDGAFIAQWGGEGGEPGQFRSPSGVAIDGQGNVYVADTGNGRVQVLDAAH
jgi:tripartite motif-containing protein 71